MPIILSQFIHAYRWLGCLFVLAWHTMSSFVNFSDIMTAPHSPFVYAWWAVVHIQVGRQAVAGFFVISGYLVGGAVLAALDEQRDFLRGYFIDRFSRIYIVLIPALCLTGVLDFIGRIYFPAGDEYNQFQAHYAADIFIANLFNLEYILTIYYGTNGPLWSVACEFWYYVIFPLLLLPLARNYPLMGRLSGFLFGLGLFLWFAVSSPLFRSFSLLWGIGALAYLAPRPLMRSRWGALAAYVVVLIPARFIVHGPVLDAHPWLQDATDVTMAILFANLLITLRFGAQDGWSFLRPRFHASLADFSYSLYIIHGPLLMLIRAVSDEVLGPAWTKTPSVALQWWMLFAAIPVVVGAAYGFSRFTEARTGSARRLLRAWLSPAREPRSKLNMRRSA